MSYISISSQGTSLHSMLVFRKEMAGLTNLGHVCYANIVLQSLSNCEEIHQHCSQHYNMHTIPDPTRICPHCCLYDIMTKMLLPPDQPLSKNDLQPFYDALSIDVNKMGDPREFLVDILRKDFPELQIFFGFGVSTEIYCQSCYQTFSSVIDQVEIEISATCSTLAEGLTKYLAVEDVESYDCQVCESYVDAYLQRRITNNPSYLVLHRSGAEPIDLSFVLKINKEDYILDSFIEFIAPRSKRSVGHYISFKKVNQVWLNYNNTVCRKASLMGSFRVNLAFYRSASKSHTVPYSLDFAKIKSLRGRKRPNVSKTTTPLPVKKTSLEAFLNQDTEVDSASLEAKSALTHSKETPLLQSEHQEPQPSTSQSGGQVTESGKDMGTPSCTSDLVTGELGLVISNITTLSQEMTESIPNLDLQQKETPNTSHNNATQSLDELQGNVTEDPHMSEAPKVNEGTSGSMSNADPSTSDVGNTFQNLPHKSLEIPKTDTPKPSAKDSTDSKEKHKKPTAQGGGMSAADMPPLELNRHLMVDCERYVNLLKRFQEGKVHVKQIKTPEERLTNIKQKSIPLSLFEKFYTESQKADDKLKKLAEQESRPTESGEVPSEQSGDDEADDTDTDPDYKPSVDDVEQDTEETPNKCKKSAATALARTRSTRSTPQATRRLTRIAAKNTGGKTKASKDGVIPLRKNVRRDGVDEKHKGEKYVRWTGTKGLGLHNSQIADSTVLIDYLPPFQNVGQNCLLCPQEKVLDSDDEIIKHYRCVHISRLINIHQINILMCRCSEVRSRGTDNSVRNRHYHCIECWHPFDTKVKLRVHILSKHSELYTLAELQHWAPGRHSDKKAKKKK